MSNAVLLRAAAEWLRPRLNKEEVLILGHTRAAADEFVRGLGAGATLGLHRMTLTQLAAQLAAARMAGLGLSPATRLGVEAVAARVIHRLHKAGRLAYFGRVAMYPGFPSALAATLTDLRLAGVRPETGDLAALFTEYEKELASRGVADLATVLRLATEAAKEWERIPSLLLGVDLRTPAHRAFAEAVGAERVEAGASAAESALDHARVFLFSQDRPPVTSEDGTLDGFAAPGEGLEAVEIARRIRLMDHTPFDRIAILLRSPERYQFLVEEALRRAGIPSYFSRGSARPDAAGRAFLALLACAQERCSASRFAEYLSLGQVPEVPGEREPEWVPPEDDTFIAVGGAAVAREPETEPAATPATPIAWERLLVDAAVIGGRARWERRLRGLEQEYRLQSKAHGPDERIERQLERLQNLERFALPVVEQLDALPSGADWSAWLAGLRKLAATALREPESVLGALAELEPMAGIGPVEIDEVIQVLSDRLRFLRREPPHRRYGRVFVGSLDEARGRSFDVVFLPGLAEGLFPRRTFEDPLLLDEARAALSAELPLRKDKSDDERELLSVALAAASKRFIYSYPSMDVAQGRPRVPSLYALELARAVEGRVPKLDEFERRMTAAAEARLTWPAPKSAADAIDDAEYDLAWHKAHEREPGSSAYLLKASPVLARSLRTRYKRWSKEWSDADGLVSPDAAGLEALRAHAIGKRSFSPTALQSFSACPYKFYLYAVCGIRERETVAALEQLDPLTRGALFHAVQFSFFETWRRRPFETLQGALDGLDRALNDTAEEFRETLAPAIERVWKGEIEELRTDLRGWLRVWFETQRDWEPVHFEFAFGLKENIGEHHDPASTPDPAILENGVLVRGSIDLVERHRTRGVLRVTDHKTGKPPLRTPVCTGGGAALQPALYGLAAEALLGHPAESGRLFYCTQRGGFTEIDILLGDPTRERFFRTIRTIDNAVHSGFLPAAPTEDACELCDYRVVCGPYERQRVSHKPRPDLEPLNEVRGMP